MSEIFFRAKRKDTGEWVYGFYVCLAGIYHYILTGKLDITNDYSDFDKFEVDPKTVGIYIGSVDICNRKLFTGDVVRVKYNCSNGETTTEVTVVQYDEINCCFSPISWNQSCEWCDYSTEIKEIEVVGNIYDNPELIKGAMI